MEESPPKPSVVPRKHLPPATQVNPSLCPQILKLT